MTEGFKEVVKLESVFTVMESMGLKTALTVLLIATIILVAVIVLLVLQINKLAKDNESLDREYTKFRIKAQSEKENLEYSLRESWRNLEEVKAERDDLKKQKEYLLHTKKE